MLCILLETCTSVCSITHYNTSLHCIKLSLIQLNTAYYYSLLCIYTLLWVSTSAFVMCVSWVFSIATQGCVLCCLGTEKPYVSLTPRGLQTTEVMEGSTLELRVEVDAYPSIQDGRWCMPQAINTSVYMDALSTVHRRFIWKFSPSPVLTCFRLITFPRVLFSHWSQTDRKTGVKRQSRKTDRMIDW